MRYYDIDLKKHVAQVLPSFMRHVGLLTLLWSAVASITVFYRKFTTYRIAATYRLNHNGQVCYLRGMLNDNFDNTQRRITVEDAGTVIEPSRIFWRSEDKAKRIYLRSAYKEWIINRRGFGATGAYDFVIKIPSGLSLSTDLTRLKALANSYKLVSKRYSILFV
jgi:hypothetical protein